jgi:two-component system response regulator PilR (NtrC family)
VTRLGAAAAQALDARVIAMTNADLEGRVAEGRFREDLYYRLNVFRIQVPPLRERAGDVVRLAHHFLARESARLGRALRGFRRECEQALLAHTWPGNVRELENVVAQACLRARGDSIDLEDLTIRPLGLRNDAAPADAEGLLERAIGLYLLAAPPGALARVEELVVARALAATGGNQVRAAKLLGTSRNVVRKRIERYSL